MDKKDLKKFEERLLKERKRVLAGLGHLENEALGSTQKEASGDLSAYSYHPADLGTDTMEKEKDVLLVSTTGDELYEIDDALRRIQKGTFAKCEKCGKSIEKTRLNAVPYARFCLKCRQEEEKQKEKKP
ncbi:MAG: TraR/DksA C4-type zinc finger protein [Candidatus Edwardsbacteria bacterium]